MRIGFVLCEHPVDVRIKKEARALASAGHTVIGLVQEQYTNQRLIETDGLTLQTYPSPPPSEFQRALTFIKRMSFMRIPVEKRIERFAVANSLDALHVHDLPNVWAAIRVGRRLGIPVIADFHENYASAVRAYVTGHFKPQHIITTNQTLWHNYQRRCARAADRVIVVIEEGRDVITGYGIPADRVHVVPNYVDLDYLAEYSAQAKADFRHPGKFVISHIGYIGLDKGVDTAIRAMSILKTKAPDALLVIVGDAGENTEYMALLHKLAKDLDVEDVVEFAGWQPFDMVPGYLAACDVGLAPLLRNPHRDNTISNKLFDYMGFAKPVIASDCPPTKRIVEDAQAGLVFRAGSPEELADAAMRLYNDREMSKQLGENGARGVKNRYNWGTSAAELTRTYDMLSGVRGKPAGETKIAVILHYQSPVHDNMGSRALSEGLLNLTREQLGKTHQIRLMNESPWSPTLSIEFLGTDPATAVERFDRLVRRTVRRLGKDLNEDRETAICAVDELKNFTHNDVPSIMVDVRRTWAERALTRLVPSVWGMSYMERRLLKLARFDTVVYNGNGYFADYYGDALVRRLFELYAAALMGKQITACNMSVDLKSETLRALTAHVFNHIPRIVVRESLSRDELISYGVDENRVVVGADAAVYTSVEAAGDLTDVFGENPPDPANSVALILRGDRGSNPEDCARLVAGLKERLGLDVVLISSSLKQDGDLMAQTAKISGAPMMKASTTHPRFIAMLSAFKLVVSQRYHPCVFCICTQTPVVPLAGNTLKTNGLFSLFPYSIKVLTPDFAETTNREAILTAAEYASANRQAVCEELAAGYALMKTEARKNVQPAGEWRI